MNFAIKDGYRENPSPVYYDDQHPDGVTSQPDVYPYAAKVAAYLGISTLFDLGCGHAHKLSDLHDQHPQWRLVGVDYGANIDWCRRHYDWGEWLDRDFDRRNWNIRAEDALIICADVIEHLRNPNHLLRTIRESGCQVAILSTPERDLTWGEDHQGPPPNNCHVREWNRAEFVVLLQSQGFCIDTLTLTASDDAGSGDLTILAVVR